MKRFLSLFVLFCLIGCVQAGPELTVEDAQHALNETVDEYLESVAFTRLKSDTADKETWRSVTKLAILFYNNDEAESKALAFVFKHMMDEVEGVKYCVYKVSDKTKTPLSFSGLNDGSLIDPEEYPAIVLLRRIDYSNYTKDIYTHPLVDPEGMLKMNRDIVDFANKYFK